MSDQQFKVGDTVRLRDSLHKKTYTITDVIVKYRINTNSLSWCADELELAKPPITEDDIKTFADDFYTGTYSTMRDALKALYEAVKKRGIA